MTIFEKCYIMGYTMKVIQRNIVIKTARVFLPKTDTATYTIYTKTLLTIYYRVVY